MLQGRGGEMIVKFLLGLYHRSAFVTGLMFEIIGGVFDWWLIRRVRIFVVEGKEELREVVQEGVFAHFDFGGCELHFGLGRSLAARLAEQNLFLELFGRHHLVTREKDFFSFRLSLLARFGVFWIGAVVEATCSTRLVRLNVFDRQKLRP